MWGSSRGDFKAQTQSFTPHAAVLIVMLPAPMLSKAAAARLPFFAHPSIGLSTTATARDLTVLAIYAAILKSVASI